MKAISSILLLAGLTMGLTGCSSSEEPAVTSPKGDITITVNAPVESGTRAAVNLPEGYTMQCVLQLLDNQNKKVGEQKTATIDATTGKGSFTISAADQETGVKALFWAQYIDASGKSIYNTADLTSVGYTPEGASLNIGNPAVAASADAFCGKLDALANGVNVNLTRPFANVKFTPRNKDAAAGATKMTVTYDAPSGYDVFTGKTSGTTKITLTNESFNPESEDPWFSSFIFEPVDDSDGNLDSDITIKLTGGSDGDKQVVIKGGNVPLTGNYQIDVEGEIGNVEVTDITINFEVNPGYNQPEAPNFEVGAYVNAAGVPVAKASEAVGIVFNVGALKDDAIANYHAKFAGKTIKGYAVALENTATARLSFGEAVSGLQSTTGVNGAQDTSDFLSHFATSAFATTFTTWTTSHAVSGDNVTTWYIPTFNQLTEWINMLCKNGENEATGSDAFKALFPANTIFDRDPFEAVMYASCTINANGNVSAFTVTPGDPITCKGGQLTVTKADAKALCRPMITIFE